MARTNCALLAFVGLLVWGATPQAQDTRQFYLSPVDGSGTESDPWHSRCVAMQGMGNIDLRPYGVDAFLCASNDLPKDMTGVEQIGASYKSALGGRKGALNAKFEKALTADTVEDLIIEVIGPKIRAGKDGKLKIYLGDKSPVYQQTAWMPVRDGGLVADLGNAALGLIEPTLAWAATFTDSFNGADSNLAGDLTWTEFTGTNWTRTSNVARAASSTASAAEARADHDTDTDDQAIQATQTYNYTAAGGQVRCTVMGRKDSSGTRTYYGFGVQRDVGVDAYRLLHRVAGSPTTIADSAGATASGTTIQLIMDGTSLSGVVDGVVVVGPTTDATISGNTRGGIVYVGFGGSDNCTIDNLSIQDYTPPAARSRGGAIWFH